MRAPVFAIFAAIGLAAHPAFAHADRAAPTFWKAVQATCDATAAKPANELGRRIAQTAIDEFTSFGGHQIDSNGRLFRFGLTEAEHEEDESGRPRAGLGHLGWWQVFKYWRALYSDDAPGKLEVRGYRDAFASTDETKATALLRTSAAQLLRLADDVSDPEAREILREAALRVAIVDTSWSAAFISYVIRRSGVAPDAFQFANAHRAYIYDAFATSAAELTKAADHRLYRATSAAELTKAADDRVYRATSAAELTKAADDRVYRAASAAEMTKAADDRVYRATSAAELTKAADDRVYRAASAAELTKAADDRVYRACPLSTKPRVGDLICAQREPALADSSDAAVRERILEELAGSTDARSVRRTHCEVVAHIDAQARKVYTIGGNVNQAVTARKLSLRSDSKFSAAQKGVCDGSDRWTLPQASSHPPRAPLVAEPCSLNDKKWFVLLQMR